MGINETNNRKKGRHVYNNEKEKKLLYDQQDNDIDSKRKEYCKEEITDFIRQLNYDIQNLNYNIDNIMSVPQLYSNNIGIQQVMEPSVMNINTTNSYCEPELTGRDSELNCVPSEDQEREIKNLKDKIKNLKTKRQQKCSVWGDNRLSRTAIGRAPLGLV